MPNAIKLPAVTALGEKANGLPESALPIDAPMNYRTYREIQYVERDSVGILSFDFYNGAMGTEQCRRLIDAYAFARSRPTRVIVLAGGRDFFSNGIHLNLIEQASDPAQESWENINAIGASAALRIGLVDAVFGDTLEECEEMMKTRAAELAASASYDSWLAEKAARRARDESLKPLAAYRAEELARMRPAFRIPRVIISPGCSPSFAWAPPHTARVSRPPSLTGTTLPAPASCCALHRECARQRRGSHNRQDCPPS